MATNDFIGSFAQENVVFKTQIIKTAAVGDNFWKVMIFVEDDRFVDSSAAGWVAVPGSTTAKALTVTADTYATETNGLLKSWLYDLFVNGFAGDCILVTIGAKSGEIAAKTTALEAVYELMKAYAYHKTICVCDGESATAINPAIAVSLAQLCAADKEILSSAPYYPYATATPETLTSDPLYSALNTAKADAFMSCQADATRNGALYSLGLALSILNASGTAVGNSLDMIASSNITASGPDGLNLSRSVRSLLEEANIQTFKPVGNNTGDVAALGAKTLNGEVVQANWILAYITYMVKVRVAEMITRANFLRNETSYGAIISTMSSYIGLFGSAGSGRLTNVAITAPAFSNLPESGADEIIVPDAWSATYVDQVRKVQITGTLYIGV